MITNGLELRHPAAEKVNRHLAGGFTSAELVEDAAEAASFALGAGVAGRCAHGSTSEPSARLLPPACL